MTSPDIQPCPRCRKSLRPDVCRCPGCGLKLKKLRIELGFMGRPVIVEKLVPDLDDE